MIARVGVSVESSKGVSRHIDVVRGVHRHSISLTTTLSLFGPTDPVRSISVRLDELGRGTGDQGRLEVTEGFGERRERMGGRKIIGSR